MGVAMKKILKALVEAQSVTGRENNVRNIMKKEFEKSCDSVEVNKMGNIIAKKGKGKIKLMFVSHMDEVGLMVKYVTENGFLRFDPLGGIDQRSLLAQKVRVYADNGKVFVGVIGSKPIHIQEREEQEKVIKMKRLFIDVGAGSRKEVEKMGIKPGAFVGLYREFSELADNKVTGNGLDNRAGCAVLIELMKRVKPKNCTIYAVGSVQEEKGLIGARGTIFQINPDVVIGVDTTIAGDTPEIEEADAPVKIGEGPVIVLMDGYSVIHPSVKKWIMETAERNKIKYQFELSPNAGMDSSVAAIIREGIPAAGIAVPTRYLHTGVEVLSMKDLESVAGLLEHIVKTVDKYF